MTPGYVAIITDGNGRWAQRRGLPVIEGHRAGADVVKARLRDAVDLGIEELTVFSFSTENWSRPTEEVSGLMAMFGERILGETPELDEEGVRMRFIGRREGVDAGAGRADGVGGSEDGGNTRITLFIAFNYGGRAEIVDAARSFQGGSEEEFRRHLYAPDMHDPDLLIRTSGEQRISNYLLWQCAYSELVFPEELWPDFDRAAFERALAEFTRAPAALRGALMSDFFEEEMFEAQPGPGRGAAARGVAPPTAAAKRATAARRRPRRRSRAAENGAAAARRCGGSSSRCRRSSSRSRSPSPVGSSSRWR